MRANLLRLLGFLLVCAVAGAAEAAPRCPATLPGTEPLSIFDPVQPDRPGERTDFGCYGACGPSCDCVGKRERVRTETISGVRCRYRLIACRTHAFCRWHDRCYLICDRAFWKRGARDRRMGCYRGCDAGCLTGLEPAGIPSRERVGAAPGAPYPFAICAAWAQAALAHGFNGLYEPRELVFSEWIGSD